jgi:hypothetical protein
MLVAVGPDTLVELREAYLQRATTPPLSPFAAINNSDAMIAAEFRNPVPSAIVQSRLSAVMGLLRNCARSAQAMRACSVRAAWVPRQKR